MCSVNRYLVGFSLRIEKMESSFIRSSYSVTNREGIDNPNRRLQDEVPGYGYSVSHCRLIKACLSFLPEH